MAPLNINYFSGDNIIVKGNVPYHIPLNKEDLIEHLKREEKVCTSLINDTSSVISMGCMFANSMFYGDISNWDTSNVTNMSGMFTKTNFGRRDISKWNMRKVRHSYSMFPD